MSITDLPNCSKTGTLGIKAPPPDHKNRKLADTPRRAGVEEIGARLRAARKQRGLSTGQLAAAVGLSRGFLSQLERGLTSASIGTIARICDELGVRVGELFESGRADIVRSDERPLIRYRHREAYEYLLTPPSNGRLEVYESWLAPGAQSEAPYAIRATVGFIYVLAGVLEFCVGGHTYTIRAGDSLTYSPNELHTWRNPSAAEETRLIWVVTGWPTAEV